MIDLLLIAHFGFLGADENLILPLLLESVARNLRKDWCPGTELELGFCAYDFFPLLSMPLGKSLLYFPYA